MIEFEIVATGTDVDIDADYYAYIRRDTDEHYLDQDDGEFKVFQDLVDGQIPLQELGDQPGVWQVEVDIGDTTGSITFLPRDADDDTLLTDQVERLFVKDGERVTDPRLTHVALHTHYGGINQLRLINEDGEPLEGINVSVYYENDYLQGDLENILGVTVTNEFGGWSVPVFVPVGNTYTIVYHKEGEINSVTKTITIP